MGDVGEIAGVEEEPDQVGVTVIEIHVRVDARFEVVEETFVGARQTIVGDGLLGEPLTASSARGEFNLRPVTRALPKLKRAEMVAPAAEI